MTTRRPDMRILLAAALGVAGAACDGLADRDYPGQAYGVIRGTLSATEDPDALGEVSFALMWIRYEPPGPPPDGEPDVPGSVGGTPDPEEPERPPRDPDPEPFDVLAGCTGEAAPLRVETHTGPGASRWVSQPVSYQARFPIEFTIPLHELPPPEARHDLADRGGGTGWIALGVVVAFEDGNGDGVLDRHLDGTPSPDRLLDVSSGHTGHLIAFLDGTPARLPPFLGWSLDVRGALPQGLGVLELDGEVMHVRPTDTPVRLTVPSGRPQGVLALFECEEVEQRFEYGGRPPDGDLLRCFESEVSDGRTYYWYSWFHEWRTAPCAVTVSSSYYHVCLAADRAAPEDWPCRSYTPF